LDFFGPDAYYAILTSNFGYKEAVPKLQVLGKYGIRWATQMSCDVPWERHVGELGAAGMFMMNMGVESGSPQVLRRMNKTKDPMRYLESARRILERSAELQQFKSRVNIIIYPGENDETLAETRAWLESVKFALDGIICCVPIAYPGSHLIKSMGELQQEFGAAPLSTAYCLSTHHFPIAPSREISFARATRECLRIEEDFSPTRLYTVRHNYRVYEAVSSAT
jgi:hypothetical protein